MYPLSLIAAVQQSWWGTWQAALILIMAIILAAIAAVAVLRRQLHTYRRRTHQMENLVSARTIELAIANADLERLSVTDPLTGLKNRRYLEYSITEDLARVRRSLQHAPHELEEERPGISFLLVDIDHFKQVNDCFGHPAGDRVLRQIGATFASIIRESDTIIRWGGEEFLIVARNTRGNDCAILAERIRKQVASTPFTINDARSLQLTCSIGFASWPFFPHAPDSLGWQEIIDLIDCCLYAAKNSGRNTWIGAAARPDYKGDIHPAMLNSLTSAEAGGLITLLRSPAPFGATTADPSATNDSFHIM
jgi:diguanylate cyclase (GGDEF)-like protein